VADETGDYLYLFLQITKNYIENACNSYPDFTSSKKVIIFIERRPAEGTLNGLIEE
jgi:hypothetical protein